MRRNFAHLVLFTCADFWTLVVFYADFVICPASIYMQGGSLAILNKTSVNSDLFPLKGRGGDGCETSTRSGNSDMGGGDVAGINT